MEDQRHKKVQVIIFDMETKSKVLLLQTKEDRNFHWQNVTGSIEGSESFLLGAHRELLEETGLTGEPVELDIEFKFTDRWQKNVIERAFLVFVPFTQNVSLSEQEHQSFEWYEANKLNENTFGYKTNWKVFQCARSWIENNI